MGAGASKPEDVAALAKQPVTYSPPLGPPNPQNPLVYFDLKLGRYGEGTPIGKIIIELKEDVCPRTAANFKELCVRPEGEGYRGSRFHRVIPNFMCQGGDFTQDNGRGGKSIYGPRFADENFNLRHTGPGILSMANAGPNTNGSQFFLCTVPTGFLDGKHVVFGQVVDGYNVVKAVEACGSRGGDTSYDVMIADCGVLNEGGASGSGGSGKPGSVQACYGNNNTGAGPAAAMRISGRNMNKTPAAAKMMQCRRAAIVSRPLRVARAASQSAVLRSFV